MDQAIKLPKAVEPLVWADEDQKQLSITAMIIWEIIDRGNDGPWEAMRLDQGSFNMRDHCNDLAPYAEALWRSLSDDDCGKTDFDWEWIPAWLTLCVDWSGEAPVVLADRAPDIGD